MTDTRSSHPSQKRYPPELRERAVRMVLETIEQTGQRVGVITRIARQLGVGSESLRSWVRQAEVDGGRRAGVPTAERQRVAELEREVRELRRANEILKAASAFMLTSRLCRLQWPVVGVVPAQRGVDWLRGRHNHRASRKARSVSGGR